MSWFCVVNKQSKGAGILEKAYSVLTAEMVSQIRTIRKSGKVNMFDIKSVQLDAYSRGFHDLVTYLKLNAHEYVDLVMTGQAQGNNWAKFLSS